MQGNIHRQSNQWKAPREGRRKDAVGERLLGSNSSENALKLHCAHPDASFIHVCTTCMYKRYRKQRIFYFVYMKYFRQHFCESMNHETWTHCFVVKGLTVRRRAGFQSWPWHGLVMWFWVSHWSASVSHKMGIIIHLEVMIGIKA